MTSSPRVLATRAPPKTGTCKILDEEERRRVYGNFLRQHGDDIPEETIVKMVAGDNINRWATICDERGDLLAVGHFELMDWYSCAIKGLAVKPEARGFGLGTEIASRSVALAQDARSAYGPRCLVLAADVTVDNFPSIRALQRSGFAVADAFCWSKGEKPANILHMVRFKPEDRNCEGP